MGGESGTDQHGKEIDQLVNPLATWVFYDVWVSKVTSPKFS